MKCIIEGCNEYSTPLTEFCMKHYKQQWYLKNTAKRAQLLPQRVRSGRWIHTKSGYVMIWVAKKGLVYEHRELAEKALGKPLPPKAIVHHMYDPGDNHGFGKLVVCPDQEYHLLLHRRMEELGWQK